ncbi:MAG: hypothetical protein EBR79_00615 [Proteobacteria bacterium]|nr:hypothetical protein [Pseudomonadota bacterium]NBX85955.1 hypothetical protein [Pseudomonadota bacterium]
MAGKLSVDAFTSHVVNARWAEADACYEALQARFTDIPSAPIFYLIANFQTDDLRVALKRYPKMPVNRPNKKGQAPLLKAYHVANTDAAEMLLAAGAEVTAVDHYGNDIVQYATWSKLDSAIEHAEKQLLAAGKKRQKQEKKKAARGNGAHVEAP